MYTYTMTIPAPPDRVFPLLCPRQEHAWLADWHATILRSTSGFAEPGCVFQSGDGAPAERCTWIIVDHVPPRRVRFALVQPGQFAETLAIDAVAAGEHTVLTWRREVTPLAATATEVLAGRLADADAKHAAIAHALAHYLTTGTCLMAGA